ncbi:transducin beta-like protein 2 isoform X2 [Hemicordylus capensis]|uniref:transducin beta-like protein 2 isoform X2 n=1 Tax=Hemicordylus capensis TaxID=884348 RepID=UPI002302AAD9|nr:transducin beta-like protein 2 isoform X2 [Hemicordylus capensis]
MEEATVALVGLSLLLGAVVLWLLLGRGAPGKTEAQAAEEKSRPRDDQKLNGEAANKTSGLKKQKQHQRARKEKPQQHSFSHPLLAAALKGHSGSVTCLDFSSNGKYLASCSDDRTVRIWSTKDFLEQEHRCMQANVELDHATLVRFYPDSRAFVIWLANGDTIQVFRMAKKEDGSFTYVATPEEFPKQHKAPVINIGVAGTEKFIMTASSDTTILIWDLKGEILASINTNQMNNAYAAVSPCGRFVALCGFTPVVKVWEVCFSKGGDFREVARAFELKGHKAGICSFFFSNDSRRMATISKDGTWKLWDTDVEYKKQQDPYLLLTGKCEVAEPCRIALSPDARALAISCCTDIFIYNTRRGEEEERFEAVHGEPITDLAFDVNSRFLASSGDRAIRVFHNTVGYRAVLEEMKALLKKATNESTRQRLQQQITSAQDALASIYAKTT